MLSSGPERLFQELHGFLHSFRSVCCLQGGFLWPLDIQQNPPCLHPSILFPYCFPLCFPNIDHHLLFVFTINCIQVHKGDDSVSLLHAQHQEERLTSWHSVTQSLNKWIDKWTCLAQRAQNIDTNCVSRRPSSCHFLTAAKIEINLFNILGSCTHKKWKPLSLKSPPHRSPNYPM